METVMKTILIATDGSDPAGQALDVAIDLARETGAALAVLSVRPPRPAGRGGVGPAMLEIEEHDGPQHIAEAAAQHAREAGIVATPHSAQGDVVTCIADAATALGAELLVVGSRGHGSLSGAVLGSVSHALVRRSPVPVTIVRHAAVHAAVAS
jgi:nucleotide-binding universal stress UspA family protein